MKTDPIRSFIDLHAGIMACGFNYAYFELARTRGTDWMAWLCTNARELDPAGWVFATGQGTTPDEACLRAISSFVPQVHAAWNAGKITSQQAEQLSNLVRFPAQQNHED